MNSVTSKTRLADKRSWDELGKNKKEIGLNTKQNIKNKIKSSKKCRRL